MRSVFPEIIFLHTKKEVCEQINCGYTVSGLNYTESAKQTALSVYLPERRGELRAMIDNDGVNVEPLCGHICVK